MSRPEDKRPNRKKRLRVACIAAAVAVLVFGYTPPGKAMWAALMRAAGLAHFTASLPEDALHVHVIDVGKADAILLESPDANVLVDCATWRRAGSTGSTRSGSRIRTTTTAAAFRPSCKRCRPMRSLNPRWAKASPG